MSIMPRFGQTGTALVMLATATFFLGGAMVTAKVAVSDIPPMTVAATRFALASLLLLSIRRVWPALDSIRVAPRLADLPVIVGLGLTAAVGYNILLLTGVKLAPAADAALIGPAVGTVVSTAIAAAFMRERVRPLAVAGLGLSIAGVLLVVSPDGAIDLRRVTGDLLFVGCGALWGTYLVISRIAGRRFSPINVALYGSLVGAVVLVPLAVLEDGPARLLAAGLPSLLAVGHLAALATVTAFVLLNEGLHRLGVSRSASVMMMIPVFGVMQAVLVLGEPMADTAIAGALLVAGGIWGAQGGRLPSLAGRAATLRASAQPT
jgi:drug/metabolite transporter (DMT)-like permease